MNKIYWNENIETMELDLIKNLQSEKLSYLIKYVKENSPYYKDILKSISEIRTVDDITILPFTDPHHLIDNPFRFKSCKNVCRIHCSGGTVTSPKILFFTSEDLNTICDLAARKFYMMGVRSSDRVALMQPFDIYLVGFGHMEAYKQIGAEVIPLGVRLEQYFAVNLMKKLQATIIDSSPSIIARLTNAIIKSGLKPAEDFSVKKIILAGEKIRESLREFIERTWEAEVFNDYGLTEMGIVAAECEKHTGLHIAVDHYIVEVVDPLSGGRVQEEEIGELVLTPLNLRGTPLLRYRTGDLVKIKKTTCSCGRTHPLIEMIGRKDETLMIDGINLYPYQFDRALEKFAPEVLNYQIIRENIGEVDRLRIMCEVAQNIDKDKIKSKIFYALKHVSIDFLEILEKSSIERCV
ncbi:MAG TPA: phenylacetate--CoA ligase family protein [Candidatus Atribacteria bacterium]|nr:phenylacetate--CoA ligase family protein [Candidatus Atribacteria bacterium]